MSVFAAAVTLLAAGPAMADYTVCNDTSYVLDVATGETKNKSVKTQGWFRILPGSCKQVIKGKLGGSSYFLFARTPKLYDQILKRFSGGRRLCVSNNDFVISGADKCNDPAHAQENFIEIKPDGGDWKTSLTGERVYKPGEAEMAGVQRLLLMTGYDIGEIDGVAGDMTNRAIADFMGKAGIESGKPTGKTIYQTLISAARSRQNDSGLQICNETRHLVWSALGLHEAKSLVTRGWYKILPGECIRPIRKPLDGQIIYSFGEAVEKKGLLALPGDTPLIWDGEEKLCTKDTRFTINTQGKCKERGFKVTGFRKINLGGAKSWVIRYTEPQ